MKVVVTAEGTDIDAATSPVFGRCPAFVFVDSDTMETEGVMNPSVSQSGGAGIQAAQFVVDRGAKAVLSHNIGPNAFSVLEASGLLIYRVQGGTVREAVEAFNAGTLEQMGGASTAAHSGMGGRQR